MRKTFLRLGSLAAFLAVGLGAFGAHGLKAILSPEEVNTFEIGVRYQFYHAFALLAVGILAYSRKNKLLHWAGWLFVAGIVLFSGSLYLLAVREEMGLDLPWLGPITPIGGGLFIAGWLAFLVSTFMDRESSRESKSRS